MISDRKYTDVEGTYLGNDTKLYGELTNVIFGCAGSKDMIYLFRRYVVGDVTILRDSQESRYTQANLLQKLSGIMNTIRSVRSGADFSLKVMIARLVSGSPELHVIDSLGKIDHDFTTDWITIGSGTNLANPLLEREFKANSNIKDFASLGYSIIKYIEEQDRNGSVGVGADKPNIAYFRNDAQSDTQPPEPDWRDFEKSFPEYSSRFNR